MVSAVELMVDIFALSVAVFFSLRRIKEPNGLSTNHSEVAAILTELLAAINVIRLLLSQIAQKVVFTHPLDEKIIDSAYTRYWTEISNLYDSLTQANGTAMILKQGEINKNLSTVLEHLYLTVEYARSVQPDQNHIFPDTRKLKEQVDKLDYEYIQLLSSCDHYVKTEKIARRSIESIMTLVFKK